ncbi:6,7-dimethyl-8-ribityllumazine synthase [Longibacter sp.]|jgi:6,7-dimethyl-8-ribityllumazine synthase|uniref:6,7-dimethyl-8-ribityllumazine synthase n=1 Tax=Longibacter sp. TaxID=2045415 RepID=UPI003EBB186C
MPEYLEGDLVVRDHRFGIVVSRFNDFITEEMLDGALRTIKRHGGDPDKVVVARVPGSLELPVAAKKMAESGSYDAVICIGAVIRGATTHYDYVCSGTTSGTVNSSLETGVPIIFGVITTETIEQAIERAGTKAGNKGAEAAAAAIEMANLMEKL